MERGQKAYEAWCKEIFGGAGDWECVGRKDRWAAVEAACAPQMPADVAALVKRLEAGLEGLPAGPWKHVPWHIAEGGSEVRVAEGWLLCCTSADGYARHIANCDPDTIRALLSALQAQAAEIVRLQDRLEMRSAYKLDADGSTLVKVDVETGSIPDGIDCRDETIKGLDKLLAIRSAALAEAVDRAEAAERVRDDLFEQIAELRKSADWHKSQECMALQNEIVHRAEAAEAKLREAVGLLQGWLDAKSTGRNEPLEIMNDATANALASMEQTNADAG